MWRRRWRRCNDFSMGINQISVVIWIHFFLPSDTRDTMTKTFQPCRAGYDKMVVFLSTALPNEFSRDLTSRDAWREIKSFFRRKEGGEWGRKAAGGEKETPPTARNKLLFLHISNPIRHHFRHKRHVYTDATTGKWVWRWHGNVEINPPMRRVRPRVKFNPSPPTRYYRKLLY